MERWEKIDGAIDRVETILIVVFLSAMMLLAFLQIFLRNVLMTGFAWGDMLLRNLVLWIGFIGATLATREGKHINIDAISRSLPPFARGLGELAIHIFSCFICSVLAFSSFKFVRNEAQMGTPTLLGIPIWILEVILPFAFALMALRFALRLMKSGLNLKKGISLDRGEGK